MLQTTSPEFLSFNIYSIKAQLCFVCNDKFYCFQQYVCIQHCHRIFGAYIKRSNKHVQLPTFSTKYQDIKYSIVEMSLYLDIKFACIKMFAAISSICFGISKLAYITHSSKHIQLYSVCSIHIKILKFLVILIKTIYGAYFHIYR